MPENESDFTHNVNELINRWSVDHGEAILQEMFLVGGKYTNILGVYTAFADCIAADGTATPSEEGNVERLNRFLNQFPTPSLEGVSTLLGIFGKQIKEKLHFDETGWRDLLRLSAQHDIDYYEKHTFEGPKWNDAARERRQFMLNDTTNFLAKIDAKKSPPPSDVSRV